MLYILFTDGDDGDVFPLIAQSIEPITRLDVGYLVCEELELFSGDDSYDSDPEDSL